MIDVDKLKASVDIAEVIGKYTKIKSNGEEFTGCCPFHTEKTPSFTVSTAKQFYYCFGCGASGDVLDFVIDYTSCTFVEACESLGGIVEQGDYKPIERRGPSEKHNPYRECEVQSTSSQIRLGDSIDLINPKREGKIWRDASPVMVHEYVDEDGEFFGYVLRLMIQGKKLTPTVRWCSSPYGVGWHMMPFGDKRPAYRLHNALGNQKQILIPEGEKAVDAAQKYLPDSVAAVGWSGGTNGVSSTDWSFCSGRKIIIWPDNDDAGMSAAKELVNLLIPHQPLSVRFILNPDMPKSWDCADKEWEDGELIAWCKDHVSDSLGGEVVDLDRDDDDLPPLESYESDYQKPEEDEPVADVAPPESMPFLILGHHLGDRYYLPFATGQIVSLAPSQHTKNNLLALAPLAWWQQAEWDISTRAGIDMATNALLQMSAKVGIFDRSRIRGRGAWDDAGRAVVHLGTTMLVDRHPTSPKSIQSRYIYQKDIDLGIDLVEPLSTRHAHKFTEICKSLSWENPLSATLLAGWCVTAPLTGMLPWRPHIWITGPAGAGKSTVLKSIIQVMLGEMSLDVEGKTSEAGIRQELGMDARPVLFDEADAEDAKSLDRIKGVLDFARVCSSGGKILKGTANGGSIRYQARASFCFSSINIPIKEFADESRISQLVLKKDITKTVDYYQSLETHIFNTITPEYASGMFSRAVCNMGTLKHNIKIFVEAAHLHFRSRRIADQVGVMLAGAYLCHSTKTITRKTALDWLASHSWEDHTTVSSKSDCDRLISRLMTHKMRVQLKDHAIDITIGECILALDGRSENAYKFDRDYIQSALSRIGIKVDAENNTFIIANTSDPLRKILVDTVWAANWARTLSEIKGSEKLGNTYFTAGIKARCIALPMSILQA